MPLNLKVSTTLWNTIEPNRKKLTEKNYALATGIAGILTRIIDQQDEIVLSYEYEHILETMALEDIPELFRQFNEIPASRPELIERGNRTLTVQLEAIKAKVEEVKDRYLEAQMKALDAKTSYINQKYALDTSKDTAQPGIVGLKAEKAEKYVPDMSAMLGEVSSDKPKPTKKRKWLNF